jgi:hypothetical protein
MTVFVAAPAICDLRSARLSRRKNAEPGRLALVAASASRLDTMLEDEWQALRPTGCDTTMSWTLRIALRVAARRRGPSADVFQEWVCQNRLGVSVTLRAMQHDAEINSLFAPETLLLLYALDRGPDELRVSWPSTLSQRPLRFAADAFGRPYGD